MGKNELAVSVGEDRVSTSLIAQTFSRRNDAVVKVVLDYYDIFISMEDSCGLDKKKIPTNKIRTKGRSGFEYLLNYNQTLFLLSLVRSSCKEVAVLKSKVITTCSVVKAMQLIKNFDFSDIPCRYVYAAVDTRGRVKIGISNDPSRRIKDLNIGNADKLEIVMTREAKNSGYSDETNLHLECSDFRIRSEWFTQEAMEVINENR
jgi:hypothetical protein